MYVPAEPLSCQYHYKAIPDPDQDTVIASERTGWPGHQLIAGTGAAGTGGEGQGAEAA